MLSGVVKLREKWYVLLDADRHTMEMQSTWPTPIPPPDLIRTGL
jgi:hypothetical protein